MKKFFDLTEKDIEIIFAYAENNMRTTETAYQIYVHRNTVEYHLDKVKRKTGLDPKKFYDLVKLISELTERSQK